MERGHRAGPWEEGVNQGKVRGSVRGQRWQGGESAKDRKSEGKAIVPTEPSSTPASRESPPPDPLRLHFELVTWMDGL